MKKTLLCTSALALTGITGAANAASYNDGAVTMNVSGYYTTTFAYVDVTGNNAALVGADFNGVDLQQNAEIWFKPSMTLDNGIKIAVDIQLEGNTNADQIDESYMTVSGNFGKVIIGSENSVGYKMTVAAPDVSSLYAQSSSMTAYVPYSGAGAGADLFRGTLGTTYLENVRNNDAQRISYFSPRFSGLQVGISYARDPGQGNGAINNNAAGVITDIVDIAANYSGSFGGVDINASARYGTANAPAGAPNPEVWGGGLNVGYAGFTFGGSYAEQDKSLAGLQDGNSYDIGLGYANGPMSYSLTYFHGMNTDNTLGAGTNEYLKTYVLAAKYKVAANFKVGAFIANTEFTSNNVAEGNIQGTLVGVSASFNF